MQNPNLKNILLVGAVAIVAVCVWVSWGKVNMQKEDDTSAVTVPKKVTDNQSNSKYTKTFSISTDTIRLGSSGSSYNKSFLGFSLKYNPVYSIEVDISESCGTECTTSPYYRGINIIDPVKNEGFGTMTMLSKDEYATTKWYNNISPVKTSTIGGKIVDQYKPKTPAYEGDVSVSYYIDVGQDFYIEVSSSRTLSIEDIIDVGSIKMEPGKAEANESTKFIVGQTYKDASEEKYVYQGVKKVDGINRDIFRYTFNGNLSDKWQDMALLDTFSSTSFESTDDESNQFIEKIKSLNLEKSVEVINIGSTRTLVTYSLKNTKPTSQNTLDLCNYYSSEMSKISEYSPNFIPDWKIIDHN